VGLILIELEPLLKLVIVRDALIRTFCLIPIILLHLHLTFIHLAGAFIQSDLQLLYMSEVARLWSN